VSFLVGFVAGCVVSVIWFAGWRRDLLAVSDFWYRQYRRADDALVAIAVGKKEGEDAG
jgi:hypothetical protein